MPLSAFHPTIQRWFTTTLGSPTAPQQQGWPRIRAREHVLIAAPTGTGKTLAAFLSAIDALLRQGDALRDETQIVYVSPLRALAADVQKNLSAPLAALRALDPTLPDLRVLVRTGDTTASARAAMVRKPPHVLVTTPESLFILLASRSGQAMLRTTRTVIVDEIHALARDKRGAHLALSLERLDALAGGVQRIGLSATQRPLELVGHLLVGAGRECALVDIGHLRRMDLDVIVPDTPLGAVCSHEQWAELYKKMAEAVRAHRTTLVFTNTRKLAERLAARLSEELGADKVACHHGSLSKETRLAAEQKLKAGELAVLVATASLELGIDIGEVDLVLQIGSARSIATLLQRVGRAGHGVARVPKGRLLPLTLDEGVEAIALLRAVRAGSLDAIGEPRAALDILAQHVVAACVAADPERGVSEAELLELARRAWPYRDVARATFDAVVALHTQGRHALLHRDAVGGRLMATKRARIPVLTSGGAIPDNADYRVLLEPEGTFVGTLNEDFAIESNRGDVFQLGNASWQVLRVEPGIVRVADAAGNLPTVPFWLGEAPARSAELSAEVAAVRAECADADELQRQTGAAREFVEQIAAFLAAGRAELGVAPTQTCLVAERFFDDSGGMQLVLHAPFGSRVNRALGLALRKRFCRGFGFELQAAANEEAVLISLGPMHSFPLEQVFDYVRSAGARELLVQALLAAPMFMTRWRWNAVRSLALSRTQNGRGVPAPLLRMRADDLLSDAFPHALACAETLPGGDIEIPDHVLVGQTIEDCLHEAMDIDGFLALLRGLESGVIARHAVDRAEPSVFACGVLSVQPYGFLDDAPLEERRSQAVRRRAALDERTEDQLAALDPAAIEAVRAEAWPDPSSLEELHEALAWIGFVDERDLETRATDGWRAWLSELVAAGRALKLGARWHAVEASREPLELLRGRLEALGPVRESDALIREHAAEILQLEAEGAVLRTRFDDETHWCNRRLLARIQRRTLERLRAEIEAVSAADYVRFLAAWQHASPARRVSGPRGVLEVVTQLAGHAATLEAWEREILPARVDGYRREWLDELSLSGELAWGRLWGGANAALRSTPISLFPREERDTWLALAEPADARGLSSDAELVRAALVARGPSFQTELARATALLPSRLEHALGELVARGLATCDAFGGLRGLVSKRRRQAARRGFEIALAGRWSLLRTLAANTDGAASSTDARTTDASATDARTTGASGMRERAADRRASADTTAAAANAEFVARVLLRRTGVVFRRVIERERVPIAWREILRVYRRLELRGELHGGRFVAGFAGEQYALPEAVTLLRRVRRESAGEAIEVGAADPLNLSGIVTPDARVAPTLKQRVQLVPRARDLSA